MTRANRTAAGTVGVRGGAHLRVVSRPGGVGALPGLYGCRKAVVQITLLPHSNLGCWGRDCQTLELVFES